MSFVGYIGESKQPEPRNIIKGQTLLLTQGSYSDYEVFGVFEALCDFELGTIIKQFKEEKKEKIEEDWCSSQLYYAFVWHLTKGGYIKDIQAVEVHLGDYGDIEGSVEPIEPPNKEERWS